MGFEHEEFILADFDIFNNFTNYTFPTNYKFKYVNLILI